MSQLGLAVWIIFAGTIVNRLGYVVTPFLVFYLGSRGVHTEQVPYVLGAPGAGNLLGPLAGGLLADRTGRRRTMLIGLIGTATAQGLLFAAPNVVKLAATTSGNGMGYAVVFRDPLMRALLPLLGIALMIYSLTEVCLPLAIRDHGLSPATLGLMATLNAVLVVMLQPVATNLLARVPQIPVLVGSSVLTSGPGGSPGSPRWGRHRRLRRRRSRRRLVVRRARGGWVPSSASEPRARRSPAVRPIPGPGNRRGERPPPEENAALERV